MKMIDTLLLAALVAPFAEVVFHTIMDHYRLLIQESGHDAKDFYVPSSWTTKERKPAWIKLPKQRSKIEKKMRRVETILVIGVPTTFLLFTLLFFVAGIYISYNYH